MNEIVSPKYLMKLVKEVNEAVWSEFKSYKEVRHYLNKWHKTEEDWNNHWENFIMQNKENGEIDLLATLHNIDGHTLLQMAVDLGVETPDFIPAISTFRNALKSDYKTANATFEKAFKQIEIHPDIAVGLANSTLESILKEIFKDDRILTKPKNGKTLYDLTCELLKEFQLFPNSDMPQEIKNIGSSLLAVNQNIEKIRSTKTAFHGKTAEDYFINDALYTYFVVNAVTTVGLFLKSFYLKKFPLITSLPQASSELDNLPF
jgi:hypothetical protein